MLACRLQSDASRALLCDDNTRRVMKSPVMQHPVVGPEDVRVRPHGAQHVALEFCLGRRSQEDAGPAAGEYDHPKRYDQRELGFGVMRRARI